ncbi:beta-propeller fold lactonase family protein [Hyphomicrobium sp.]|uniref:YVTN family beta-propeller repeat protein n=1 Tax=Hyphomicrobium sp. TaxID=82 RepID=UPI002D786F2E|nr:beta-propeller fold lactonase family protein [Hyphomicrobium sp.]HET6388001.1 beta-propeller fold lactonase family protein [Hyphomicrobium sp.]
MTDQPSDSVSFVDLKTMKEIGRIKAGSKPAGVALSPDKATAYVTAPDSKELIEIDAISRSVKRRLVLGGAPLGIAAHPSRPEVYVADWYAHKLIIVDTGKLEVSGEVAVGQSPSGLAVTPDGRLLLSADRDSDAISIIDVETRTRLGSVAVGSRPFGITIDGAGARAFTANVKSDDVTVIDIAKRAVVGRVPSGRRPYAVALAQGRGFVTDQYDGTITVFDEKTLTPITRITACDHPEGIEADTSEANVYVACWGDDVLLRIDPKTLQVTGKASTGSGPRAFGKFVR